MSKDIRNKNKSLVFGYDPETDQVLGAIVVKDTMEHTTDTDVRAQALATLQMDRDEFVEWYDRMAEWVHVDILARRAEYETQSK